MLTQSVFDTAFRPSTGQGAFYIEILTIKQNFLVTVLKNTFYNHCPSKVVTCHHKDVPWMTREIKHKLKEKTKIYKKYVKNNDIDYKQLLNEKMFETSNLIANAKRIITKMKEKSY